MPIQRRFIAGSAALALPVLTSVSTVYVSGRGTDLPLGLVLVAATALWLASVVVLARDRWWLALAPLALGLGYAGLLGSFRSSPLPAPPRYAGELPPASPPPGMAAYRLPTGTIHRSAAFAYRGGRLSERRDFAMTAVLVTHPRGDVLIDTGLGRALAAQLALMPRSFRLLTDAERGASAAEQLDTAGYDRRRLRAILATHAHWDHVSGVDELPDVPVLVSAAERPFIDHGGWLTAVARRAGAARYATYDFEGGPYLGFPRSHDLYGDGAIVVVPAPGHTPGSVIVFVALPGDRRYAFVGDLVWQLEGITAREERPWLTRSQGDHDPSLVRESILRMAALHARFPSLVIAPSHDARGFASLPRLGR